MNHPRLALLLALATLTGCQMGPDYKRPAITTPAGWRSPSATPATPGTLANLPWWSFFKDPVLTNLVAEALTNNHDLRIAVARIEEAMGGYHAQRSSLFPSADASAGWTRTRVGNLPSSPGVTGNQFDLLGVLSYEVDVWGRIRRLTEAARANLLAAEEGQRTVYISLIGSVAVAYFDLLSLDEQLEISRRTVLSREKSLELTRVRFDGGNGVVSELDIRQAETLFYGAKAAQAGLERRVALRENELNLLLGRNPGPIPRGQPLNEQRLVEPVPDGLPSDLLLRRPDILAAEQRLIAANANIGAARAAYFPSISLTATLGLQSVELNDLFDSGLSRTWSFAPQVAGPIFNAGRISGGVQTARGQEQAALAAYQQAIQSGFREVEDALISIQKYAEELDAQEKDVAAERASLELSELRYVGGVSSYTDVLDAQRFLFTAELTLAELRSARLSAVVQLYKALGGGWPAD